MIGETLGKFRILSTIGKGGMGVVYLAEHTLIGRKAAVKLLLPEMSRDEELVERFFNEAKAAAAAQHAGLVEVFDFGWTDDGSAYIVMEHLKGESLAVRLAREGRFGAELALSVARQVASALGAAHEQGVVHRDLKPENIHLLADSGAPAGVRIKILDFGIAKLAREEEHRSVKTRTGVVIGTPRYMSPEQCKSASNVDARTDIYALGCIAYEMLVGKPPFDYDNWGELVAAHIHEAVPPVRMRVPEVSQELEAIVMRAIAKDAGARYQTMAELAQDIDTLWPGARNSMVFTPVPGSLSTIRAVDTAPTIRKSRSRAPMFAMLAGAVVLAGVTAVVVAKREADVEKPAEVAAAPSVVDAAAPMIADAAHVIDSVIMPLSVKIELASNPSGADVLTTTGVNLGKTPLVREYERIDGKLELVVRLAGHQTATVVFDTSVGGKQFVKLVRAKQAVTRPRPQPRPGSGSGVTTLDPYK